MGRKSYYIRKKEGRKCYNEAAFSAAVKIEDCECTEEDYECDEGFERNGNSAVCSPVRTANDTRIYCLYASSYSVSSGYRKIVDDTCQAGVTHHQLIVPCPISLELSKSQLTILVSLGIVIILILGIESMYKDFEEVRKRSDVEQYNAVKYRKVGNRKHEFS
eukprot:TRINITY_DN13365_c0_g1_i1.p2 TRINITY_DN13365_c0_g1~~TRINITY_DN13365_c0_g1_i1.p2  ORF type:complete len:162 (+),score=19.13 TRINITY_DN13365_c0_g1_i1:497-982(+)